MSKPRLIFAGTPDFASHILEQLIDAGYLPVAVYTQPDRPAGRGKKLQPSAVKALALEHHIPVEQPLNFKDPATVEQLKSYDADLMIVIAYGLLLPESVLTTPKLGCINVHASLLPRWRGAAPIQRAIAAGDSETGVGIMQMDVGLDTGPLWHSSSIPISPQDTGASLHDKLAQLGASTLIATLPAILQQQGEPTPQDEAGVVYAHKLSKKEALVDWNESAETIEKKIRAFNSWPVAYCQVDGQVMRIWSAEAVPIQGNPEPGTVLSASRDEVVIACASGALKLIEVQPAGSRRMSMSDLLNSRQHWFVEGMPIGGPQ